MKDVLNFLRYFAYVLAQLNVKSFYHELHVPPVITSIISVQNQIKNWNQNLILLEVLVSMKSVNCDSSDQILSDYCSWWQGVKRKQWSIEGEVFNC